MVVWIAGMACSLELGAPRGYQPPVSIQRST